MAISIKREKNERGVALHTLNVGDTFMYDNRVGVIASRNGHDFPMEFSTCREFRVVDEHFWAKGCDKNHTLSGSEIVLPVEVEMTYKVMG